MSHRTHNCNQLAVRDIGLQVKLSGFLHNKRDHGGVLFIDLRDHYGITQVVIDESKCNLKVADIASIKSESVLTVQGTVVKREDSAINKSLNTGEIEVLIKDCRIESEAQQVPFIINTEDETNEELRLTYRFLDLRRQRMHNNIILRSKVINYIRSKMIEMGFLEFQTPILTASSPEGARDFLVPSRLHPGKFYALPQAPQQFKQLLMISGFDKYFQIAPCFRDEDSRADRSPGEFYQLDVEMAFVEQEDVFAVIEPLLRDVFLNFGCKQVENGAFPKITYKDSMLLYGTDKPDLRNPIKNSNVTNIFKDSGFSIFAQSIKKGAVVRGVPAPQTSEMPRSFFDNMISFAMENGAKGLAYIIFDKNGEAKGPIAKFLNSEQLIELKKNASLQNGDSVFFSCDKEHHANKIAGFVRTKVARELKLINDDIYKFAWIVDFPYFEWSEEEGRVDFSHNPFSMPQGGMDALMTQDTAKLLDTIAYQYDIVCNGVELSSGAIRNHKPEIAYRAFEIVGYTKEEVDEKFGGIIKAFKYGAPPHGGIAPGVDRILMLLLDTESIRDVIAFPMTGKAEDLLMHAPSTVSPKQLKELHIALASKPTS